MTMTRKEFEKWLIDNFFAWTSERPRERIHWISSLVDFSGQEFNRAYDEYYSKAKEKNETSTQARESRTARAIVPQKTG